MATKPKTRWTYSFSNLGPKKQIGGTTFYKVSMGSETKWLSMEGVKMLENAKRAGTQFKSVRKAAKYYTVTGTRRLLKEARGKVIENINDLISQGLSTEVIGHPSGLTHMLENAGLEALKKEFEGLLNIMTLEQIREFYRDNKLLLEKFFESSDVFKSFKSGKDNDGDIRAASGETRANGERLRDKMLKIIVRDMNIENMKKIKDPKIAALVIGFAKKVR